MPAIHRFRIALAIPFLIPLGASADDDALKQAEAALLKEDYKEAIKLFTEVIKADPTNHFTYFYRGLAYDFMEEKPGSKKALADFPHRSIEPPHIKTTRRSYYRQRCIGNRASKSVEDMSINSGARACKDKDAFDNPAEQSIKYAPVKCA